MMFRILTVWACLLAQVAVAQPGIDYFLPVSVTYNPAIPTPAAVLGYEVGEWHVTHDQLVTYMKALDAASNRITLTEYARTYEGRPLIVLTITSPANHSQLEQIRQEHLSLSDPESNTTVSSQKLVHYMGYSVHGNEASGANASLVAAYYLAAAQGPEIEQWLNETVILLDPSFNPDGLQRFSTWVNMHKSATLVADPNSREFQEAWPGGRTNHYWFDLNRDWLPVQHPESRGRIALFHQWKPNVLTDHHEMGTNSTFFFQPGVPSRKYPRTPDANVRMTERIATYHAAALDSIGSLYYSKEGFDDFFIGKGSTYPDLQGGVGILFEQASSRGHVQQSQFGKLEFRQAIRNHFVTSLSTLKAAVALKTDLLEMQRSFFASAIREADADTDKAIVLGSAKDPARAYHLVELIRQHDIQVYPLSREWSKSGITYAANDSYIIPLRQPQYRLIKAMFETRTSFTDSLFYDISTWTLPLAFDVDFAMLGAKEFSASLLGEPIGTPVFPKGEVPPLSNYAYVLEPYGYYVHRALRRLLEAGVLVEVSHAEHTSGSHTFPRGSLLIPVGIQREKQQIIRQVLQEIAEADGITAHALETGLAVSGVDLGSGELQVLEMPRMALLVESGVSSYEAGQVWHLLDQRHGMPVTLLPVSAVNRVDLSRYNRLVMVNGSYADITSQGVENLKAWLNKGGVLVAWKGAGRWLANQKLTRTEYHTAPTDTTGYKPYADREALTGAQVIGGAIFQSTLDLGHPLAYGFEDGMLPLFRDHSHILKKSKNPYANPVRYTASPLLSGYVSKQKLAALQGTPAAVVSAHGRGRIITLADDATFRAFWLGTNRLLMNALFFGQTIDAAACD